MCAAQNGHNEAIKILVQHGAGVDMQNVVSRHAQIILEYIIVKYNRPVPDILPRITGQEIICCKHLHGHLSLSNTISSLCSGAR